MCIHNQCIECQNKSKKSIKIFLLKFSFFPAVTKVCILHGHVFLITNLYSYEIFPSEGFVIQ